MSGSSKLAALAVLAVAAGSMALRMPEDSPVRVTPIVTVEAIEPCLPFWTESLGFEVTASVPGDDGLVFAMLESDGVALMYQTRASIDAALGQSGAPVGLARELTESTSSLFVEIPALVPLVDRLDGLAEIVVPRRATDYGMDEIFVRAPCGTLVGFAAPLEPGE